MTVAIATTAGHVSRAIDFVNRTDLWFKLGRSLTPWDDEMNPPLPGQDDHVDNNEVLGLKLVETLLLVVPDDKNGTLVYRDKTYRIVPQDNAYAEGARWAYVASNVAYDELPSDSIYRQIAVSSHVTLKSSVPSDTRAVTPDMVDDLGIDEFLNNRRPVYRDSDTREKAILVVEF